MNLNLSSFLQGSLKILNIINRTIPLVKEFNPTINTAMSKYKNYINKKSNENIISLPNNSITNTNNGLTFFK